VDLTKRFDADNPNPAEAPEPNAPSGSAATSVSPDPEVPPQTKQRSARSWVVAVIAGIVAIAAIVTSVVFYLQYKDKNDILEAQSAARDAMCDYAKTVTSYNYNDLDTFFKNVLDGATGEWKTEFETNSAALRDPLVAGQVQSNGDEVQCGVQSGDTENAVVVAAIGQTITSLGTQNQPQKGQIAVVATMEYVDGQWLVSKMDAPLLGS
jgi:Mce-associated membrane protein